MRTLIVERKDFGRLRGVFDSQNFKAIIGHRNDQDVCEWGTYDVYDYLKRHGLLDVSQSIAIRRIPGLHLCDTLCMEGITVMRSDWFIEIMVIPEEELDALDAQVQDYHKLNSQLLRITIGNRGINKGVMLKEYEEKFEK